jgi:hypothetical protein
MDADRVVGKRRPVDLGGRGRPPIAPQPGLLVLAAPPHGRLVPIQLSRDSARAVGAPVIDERSATAPMDDEVMLAPPAVEMRHDATAMMVAGTGPHGGIRGQRASTTVTANGPGATTRRAPDRAAKPEIGQATAPGCLRAGWSHPRLPPRSARPR